MVCPKPGRSGRSGGGRCRRGVHELGEHLALDLLNTRTAEGDLVAAPAGLGARLAEQAGRLTAVDAVGEDEVAAVRAVREAARAALDAVRRGERPPAEALRVLNGALAGAPCHRVPAWSEEADPEAAVSRHAEPAPRLAAELADAYRHC
ncbi:ABATE domain-containing protein [Streptomyces sp. NRRL F-2664]|uniref:ABATE domain-containing protein n=1 Tax=Streptomyces sp. NRRL F-2664 TaxID=1463842 RepID=UPI002D21B4A4|nr:ABATE domain-containing protein [Streptomyces sp. NRRL F-2664]